MAGIAHDQKIQSLANSYGVAVQTVSWEDTGRSKGSCVGPNISDMTLFTDRNMPVVRKPNFADVTADRKLEDFTVMVGNESESELKQVSLKEYLENIGKYSGNPNVNSMYLERDSDILTSAQACILPLRDGEVEFCVQLYNYQSYDSSDPAVLVVMSSAQGTSSQVVYGNTKLYFNDNGRAKNLKAQRLSDDRKKRGVPVDGPLTSEEKNRNALFIYQIPLKQKPRPQMRYACFAENMSDGLEYKCESMDTCYAPASGSFEKKCKLSRSVPERGFEKAVLAKGRDMGEFTGTNNLTLTRDDRFPIRCTVQYYNVTDSSEISEAQIKDISETITNTYTGALASGSLVVSTTDRKTEPLLMPPVPEKPFVATSDPIVAFL